MYFLRMELAVKKSMFKFLKNSQLKVPFEVYLFYLKRKVVLEHFPLS